MLKPIIFVKLELKQLIILIITISNLVVLTKPILVLLIKLLIELKLHFIKLINFNLRLFDLNFILNFIIRVDSCQIGFTFFFKLTLNPFFNLILKLSFKFVISKSFIKLSLFKCLNLFMGFNHQVLFTDLISKVPIVVARALTIHLDYHFSQISLKKNL